MYIHIMELNSLYAIQQRLESVSLNSKRTLPSDKGIYFVFTGRWLLYIGKGWKLNQRVRENQKIYIFEKFRNVRIYYMVTSELQLEQEYILKFRPPFNSSSDVFINNRIVHIDTKNLAIWEQINNKSEFINNLIELYAEKWIKKGVKKWQKGQTIL